MKWAVILMELETSHIVCPTEHSAGFLTVNLHRNEMGGACSAGGGRERRVQDFGREI
jgi:hypothetical protein